MITSKNANFFSEIEVVGKRDKNTLKVAFEQAQAHNVALASEFEARYKQTGDVGEMERASKASHAARFQNAILGLTEKQAASVLRYFTVERIVDVNADSKALAKVASLAHVLDAGDWSAHTDGQLANVLAKLSDEAMGERHDLRKFYAMFSSKRQREMCAKMLERMGLIQRYKDGATFVEFEKIDCKVWTKIDQILNV